ncbi:hypothetical protein B0H13DRAFT_1904126 [Mycena leptocephala]|nr:hypothetical protein B0H13DRAFT_1904126 [Mycena leptocephala]
MSELAYAEITPRDPRVKCERPACGKLLPPGIDLYILHDNKDSSNGFGVCPDCKLHYENKGAGIVFKKNGNRNFNIVSCTGLPPQNPNAVRQIYQDVARANRGRFGGHVQSLGGYSQYSSREPMGPPPLPLGQRGSIGPPPALSQRSSHYSPYGPDVRLPMGSSLAANRSLGTSTSSSGYGYTENHASYREVRSQRQQLAYAPTSDHRIMLEFRGVTRKPGRVTAEIIGDMYHVVDKVKASIGAGEIKIMAWNILGPKWAAHTDGYDLNVDDCTIHNKDWVEIVAIRSPDVNAIADRFYKPNPKSPNEPIFKTAKFLVNFCIPWAIYSAFLDRDTEQQEQSQSYDNTENSRSIESEDEDSIVVVTRTSVPGRNSSRQLSRRPSNWRSRQPSSSRQLRSQSSQQPVSKSRSAVLRPASFSGQNSPLFSYDPDDAEKDSEKDMLRSDDEVTVPALRSESDLDHLAHSATPFSIPVFPKEALFKALSQQTMPSRKEINSLMNFSAISVQASIARQRTLTDLLDNSANFESFLKTPPMDVILHLDLTHKAQKRGGFKMTAFGRSSKPMFATGSTEICGKRSYYEQKNVETGTTECIPYPSPRQAQDLMVELKCNVWSASLLEDVYAGIDRFNALSTTNPPVEILRMRFVRVAFATEGKSSERSVFLVEEQIEESREGQFRKYINNRAPIPTTFVSGSENGTRASFLAFTQHWQFKRTHGLAFVSDYQGQSHSI